VQSTPEMKKGILVIFRKIQKIFNIFYIHTEYQLGPSSARICSQNRFLVRFDFLGFFEKCAAIIFIIFIIIIIISPFMSLTGFSLGMNIFHFEAFPLSAEKSRF
jgi:hypothetical protein